ncbi:MAG: PIN domain-containing protein [Chthoniobacterales bacterium]
MILVDSSVWIELFRSHGDMAVSLAVENLASEFAAVLCGPVKMEVLGGARKSEEDRILELFDLIPYIPESERLWEQTAQFYQRLRAAGITVPWVDAMIAGIASRRGYRVYAQDKHFREMADKGFLQLYIPGPGGRFVNDG